MQAVMRKYPIGAEILPEKGVHFRVWAPNRNQVQLVLENKNEQPQYFTLEKEKDGYFSGVVEQASAESLYRFKLEQDEMLYPDPASRFQPDGPHGPSQVIDPNKFEWTDQNWKGPSKTGNIIYEMHVGTFTERGNWQSAKSELIELADLGITVIEMMPVSEFCGNFGWGYDGVNMFAPYHHYGTYDDLKSFIDCAHAVGIAVILDIVFNHFGPDGCYIKEFANDYFTHRYKTEWGDAINFDDKNSKQVREFFITNARYWIEELHFDGLRIDAIQNIYDSSNPHILSEICDQVRKSTSRKTYILGENERQQARVVEPQDNNGFGMDAVWNDDFHHSAIVKLTGHNEGYYTDYLGTPQEFISTAKYGYLYQGQWYKWQKKARGTQNLNLCPENFVNFIQNHDQIANSAHGWRIHQLSDRGNYRAMTALLLLSPGTPLLFQGQEFAANCPFYYFADHHEELSKLISKGRVDFFKQFASIATPDIESGIAPPFDRNTFNKCKLNFLDRHLNKWAYSLHRDLIKLRKSDSIFNYPCTGGIDGAIIGPDAFILRYLSKNNPKDTRLLFVNFGNDLTLSPAPEPLLAPPIGMNWDLLWSSEHPRYGGSGVPPLDTRDHWKILGHAATVLISKE